MAQGAVNLQGTNLLLLQSAQASHIQLWQRLHCSEKKWTAITSILCYAAPSLLLYADKVDVLSLSLISLNNHVM